MYTRTQLRPLAWLSTGAALLTLIAAGAGLLRPDFYPYTSKTMLYGSYAQDLIALGVAVLMLGAIVNTRRGSARAVMVWAGCLGYLIYAYLLYTFDAVYTSLYPAYIAILGASLYSLIGLLGQLDAAAFRRHVSQSLPFRATAAILAIPVLLLPRWIALMLEGVATGAPDAVNSVLVIDLSFLIPACVLTAVLLWRRRTWGIVFAGMLLVQVATMGLSLTIATLWGAAEGAPWDPAFPAYVAFTLIGGGGMVRYLRHIGAGTAPTPAPSLATEQ